MKRILIILACMSTFACGKKDGPKNDDIVGGQEQLINSVSCVASIKSLDAKGEPDKVRGFSVKLLAFLYSEGSAAMTLTDTYAFNDKAESFTETASKVFAQNNKDYRLETDLLLVKVMPEAKAAILFKKYKIGESFDMECK